MCVMPTCAGFQVGGKKSPIQFGNTHLIYI